MPSSGGTLHLNDALKEPIQTTRKEEPMKQNKNAENAVSLKPREESVRKTKQ